LRWENAPYGPCLTLSKTSAMVSENGSQDNFTVMLTTQPSSNVVLQITSDNTSEVTVSPDNLTFTTSDWNTPQPVTLTGMDDTLSDGDTPIQVLVKVDNASTADNRYHGLSRSLTVTNVDNETTPAARSGETLSAGDSHTCAVLDNGSAMCWGNEHRGRLGNGFLDSTGQTNISSPTLVQNLNDASSISSGNEHSCALLDNKSIMCWGSNLLGQLGTGAAQNTTGFLPAIVTVPGPFKSLSTGGTTTCAVLDNGSAMCWGNNFYGQLGDSQSGGNQYNFDSTIDSSIPVHVLLDPPVKAISAGDSHTCAVLDNNSAMCWGLNSSGQLGDNSTTDSSIPVAVNGLGSVKAISGGYAHTCAILNDDSLKCWGGNGDGQLGIGAPSGTTELIPVSGSGLGGVKSISLGYAHSCALLSDQSAKCWGKNVNGQLGNGSSGTDNTTPDNVLNLSTIRLP